jgi:hypothetical protein
MTGGVVLQKFCIAAVVGLQSVIAGTIAALARVTNRWSVLVAREAKRWMIA